MTDQPTTAIILAAGEGSRMKSARPKPLHEVAGLSLLGHTIRTAGAMADAVTVVTGAGAEAVANAAKALHPDAAIAEQTERLGTAHAVLAARPALLNGGEALILYADTPFIRPETLAAMADARKGGADIVILGFRAADPGGYGRLVMERDHLLAIVEAKDADKATLAIDLCNSGVVMADAKTLLSLLEDVGNDNAKGEYYLTDIVAIGRARGLSAAVVECDEAETLGVNSRADLAAAETAFQARARASAMAEGATLIAPETVWFSHDTSLGRDVTIEPNVIFGPGVRVEDGAAIRGHSHLEGCRVATGAIVGPFARLRPGADIGPGARVGNFVEVKNATLGEGAKANHLAYLGDATVGARANVGAGVITANYDGVFKYPAVIGEEAFVGSNSTLISPVTIGDRAFIAGGLVIAGDVEAEALAITRAEFNQKTRLGARIMAKLKAMKAAGQKKKGAL